MSLREEGRKFMTSDWSGREVFEEKKTPKSESPVGKPDSVRQYQPIPARPPWLDFRLTEDMMNHLWNILNNSSTEKTVAKKDLAGNVSKSLFFEDENDWFYENALKRCTEIMYFKEWDNYYSVNVSKTSPHPLFKLDVLWANYQKQHEFNPPHNHAGTFSFVIFMKIPTHWKEQHALPFSASSNHPCASDFIFLLGQGDGQTQAISVPLSPEDEGRILFFPAWLQHMVMPFYGTEEERITISGNIIQTPK